MNPIEITTIGSYDLKGIGRIYTIRPDDFPRGREVKIGSIVIHNGIKKRVCGITYFNRNLDTYGICLEDV
jgi:hypothetical protein